MHELMFYGEHRFRVAAVMKATFKAAPKVEGPSTREEEEEEEAGEKMQANPAYLPIEMMSYESQEHQYINVKLPPPDAAAVEEHPKLQASPAYLPIEMMHCNWVSRE